MVLELFWPVFILLWIGFVAAVVGFLSLIFPNIPTPVRFIVFGVLFTVAVLAWRRYRPVPPNKSE